MSDADFVALMNGKLDAIAAYRQSKIKVIGDLGSVSLPFIRKDIDLI